MRITFRKKILSIVVVSSILVLGNPVDHHSSAASTNFKDVPSTHWAKTAIEQSVSKGYFKGYADGTFKPSAQVTRAEFAVLLDRVSTNPISANTTEFADLKGKWSEKEVNEAAAKGFISTKNYPNGFQPSTYLTRKEMAKWMASGLAASNEEYKQALVDTADTVVPTAEYFKKTMSKSDYPYVSVVMGTGLMSGYEDGTFGLAKTTTRAEAAVILMRLADVQTKKADSFLGLNELRAVGTTGTNLTLLTPYHTGITSFKDVQGKKLKFKNGSGSMELNYYIVVDTRDWNNKKGIYAPVFVGKEDKLPGEGAFYRVYENQTIYPSIEKFEFGHYMNGSLIPIAIGMPIQNELPAKYGYNTLPQGVRYGFTSGMNIWVENRIIVSTPRASYTTSDGSSFAIID